MHSDSGIWLGISDISCIKGGLRELFMVSIPFTVASLVPRWNHGNGWYARDNLIQAQYFCSMYDVTPEIVNYDAPHFYSGSFTQTTAVNIRA